MVTWQQVSITAFEKFPPTHLTNMNRFLSIKRDCDKNAQ